MSKYRKTNKAKRVDSGCRNHGSCPHCRGNRTHQGEVAKQAADEQIEEQEESDERRTRSCTGPCSRQEG